ncbi:hypothetical protein [Kitasatospora sp. NPDC015120]|uniref:hypothetical protein n=1 Tax=Kitasatospora sp. NPDC015120 TaxID=3364023 RepID=UPI0036F4AFD1
MVKYTITVENKIDQTVELILEPEGGDFWMAPGESLTVTSEAPEETEVPFVVQVTNDGISVWSNCGPGAVFSASGEDLDYGYNRPESAYPELKGDSSPSPSESRRWWPWRIFS